MAESIVEVVKFRASGLLDLTASVKEMGKQADGAADRLKKINTVIDSPVLRKYAVQIDKIARAQEVASLKLRNQSFAARLTEGSETRRLRAVTALNREYAGMQRRLELSARYGERLGGFMHRYGAGLSALTHGAALASTAGAGLARAGFSGTVEAARLDSETKQLARELAGALRPAVELMTKGAKGIRKELERLDENGQDVVAGGILAGGTALGGIALRSYMGGGAFAGRAAGFARYGLLAPAAYAAYRTVNPTTPDENDPRVRGMIESRPEYAGLSGPKLRDAAIAQREREFGGLNWAQRRLGSMGHEVSGWLGFTEKRDDWRPLSDQLNARADALEGVKNGRRTVQLAGGGFQATGSGYDSLSAAIEKVQGERAAEDDGLTSVMGTLVERVTELTTELRRSGSGGPAFPRPGGGS